jgi:glucan phosphoethanolaminetransferase (alkaline phosphatase superfamily)
MKVPSSYKISMFISSFLALGGFAQGFPIVSICVILVLISPVVLPFTDKTKAGLSVIVSVIFASVAAYIYFQCMSQLGSIESIAEFEGPNGEGSPIAPIIGYFMVTILFIIPWILTAYRCIRMVIAKDQLAEQDAAPNC